MDYEKPYAPLTALSPATLDLAEMHFMLRLAGWEPSHHSSYDAWVWSREDRLGATVVTYKQHQSRLFWYYHKRAGHNTVGFDMEQFRQLLATGVLS